MCAKLSEAQFNANDIFPVIKYYAVTTLNYVLSCDKILCVTTLNYVLSHIQ